jgi:serine protease inhibitor
LQASGSSASDLDEGWAGLTSQWASAAKSAGIEFSAANSLWQQRGLELRTRFLGTLARYYASGVWQVDFRHHMPDALSAMDQWTAEHTNGKITKLFDQLDPTTTVLVLANAVYFHARWQTPFDPAQTSPGLFHVAAGAPASAQFMTSPGNVASATTSGYQVAELPYRGGRFAALAIMPTHGSLTNFVASLDGAKLADIAGALTAQSLVKLPKFTTTSKTDLVPVLKSMGMRQAFTDDADFSALSPTPTKVGQALQRVYLKVGEKGTEAAAVTGIQVIPQSRTLQTPMTFDHPFLFLVRDTKTGAVLFASAINRPDPAS